MKNRFHVPECFLAAVTYDGNGGQVFAVNNHEWTKCGQVYARITNEDRSKMNFTIGGLVELCEDPSTAGQDGAYIGVDGGDVSFPHNASIPGLYRAFIIEAEAKRWIGRYLPTNSGEPNPFELVWVDGSNRLVEVGPDTDTSTLSQVLRSDHEALRDWP